MQNGFNPRDGAIHEPVMWTFAFDGGTVFFRAKRKKERKKKSGEKEKIKDEIRNKFTCSIGRWKKQTLILIDRKLNSIPIGVGDRASSGVEEGKEDVKRIFIKKKSGSGSPKRRVWVFFFFFFLFCESILGFPLTT